MGKTERSGSYRSATPAFTARALLNLKKLPHKELTTMEKINNNYIY